MYLLVVVIHEYFTGGYKVPSSVDIKKDTFFDVTLVLPSITSGYMVSIIKRQAE
jgi:hypothetical protein